MAFIIDPKSASFSTVLSQLEAYRDSRPDADKWNAFFAAGVGQTTTEMVAALGAFLSYKVIAGRRENYLTSAVNKSSAVGISQSLGYSTFRGRNEHLLLTVVPSSTVVLPRFSVVGAIKDQDLVILADTPLTAGVAQQIEVVLGVLTREEISAPSSNRAIFRFESPAVTEDFRVLLNDNEVEVSNRILDLDENKFVAITNPLESVDVSYLNRTGAPVQYSTGDVLALEFLATKDLNYASSDLNFFFGTIASFQTGSAFQSAEDNDTTRINAPLFHETQALVRARLDFLKLFKILDPDFVSTNQRNITTAIVELSYLKSDYVALTEAEKADRRAELVKRLPMGVPPPEITDPARVLLPLDIVITLRNNEENTAQLTVDILALQENILGHFVNLEDLESQIEALDSVKIARVSIGSVDWEASTLYERGSVVKQSPDNGRVYELTRILYRSGASVPAWPTVLDETVEDRQIVWQAELINPSELTTTTWEPNKIYDLRQVVVPIVPNGRQYRAVDFINRSYSNSEEQLITFDVVPDSGTWRLLYNDGNHIQQTVNLPYNAVALDVQNALNDLECLSGVVVTGDYSAGFLVQFLGADANKPQPLLDITDPGQDEQQLISFDQVPNSGSFGLEFDGQTTAAIPYTATAATIKAALEALSNIDLVSVSGDFTNGFQVTFQGLLAKQSLPQMNQALLASPGQDEQQQITFGSVPSPGGNWRLFYGIEATSELAYNASFTDIQTALNALNGLSSVQVTGNYSTGFSILFTGADGLQPQPLLSVANPGQNSRQLISFSMIPDYGTWRLDYGGSKTSYMPFNASATQVQAAINALTGAAGSIVSGDYASGFLVEFAGLAGNKPQNILNADAPGEDEVQGLSYTLPPDRGSYRLVLNGFQTALIPFNATAFDIKAALEALPNIDLVTVAGNATFGFTITFQGQQAKQDVPYLTIANNTLFDDQVAEQTSITAVANTANVLHQKCFWLQDDQGSVAFWIDSGNVGSPEPVASLNADRSVRISTIISGDSANDVASKVRAAIASDLKFNATVSGAVITATNVVAGARPAPSAQTSTFTVSVLTAGTTVGSTPIITGILDGENPDSRLTKADQAIAISVSETQQGMYPASNLGTPIIIARTQAGASPVSNLQRSSVPVDVAITTPTEGDFPANNLGNLSGPVDVEIESLVEAETAEPVWPTALGARVYDGQVIWQAVPFNGTPDVWEPGKNYRIGDFTAPTTVVEDVETEEQLMFQAVGFLAKSDTSQPNFSTILGSSVVDGTALWAARDSAASLPTLSFKEYYDIIPNITLKGP